MTRVYGSIQLRYSKADDEDQLVLMTSDNERLLIDPGRICDKLEAFVGDWVEAVGQVRREDGAMHISIRDFEMTGGDDWDEDDDW